MLRPTVAPYEPLVTYVVAEVSAAVGGDVDRSGLHAAGATALDAAIAAGAPADDLLAAIRAAVTAAAATCARTAAGRRPLGGSEPSSGLPTAGVSLLGALGSLPSSAAALLSTLYLDQSSPEEAAAAAGIPVEQVDDHRAAALRSLAANLAERRARTAGMAASMAAFLSMRSRPVAASAPATLSA